MTRAGDSIDLRVQDGGTAQDAGDIVLVSAATTTATLAGVEQGQDAAGATATTSVQASVQVVDSEQDSVSFAGVSSLSGAIQSIEEGHDALAALADVITDPEAPLNPQTLNISANSALLSWEAPE